MIIGTKDLGNVEISEKDIIKFPYGLYGFKNIKRFVLLSNPKKESMFMWMQSVDNPETRFVVIDPLKIIKSYDVSAEAARSLIPIEDEGDIRLLAITTVTAGTKEIYANLKCPVVINSHDNIAAQIILDNEKYPMRYYLYKKEG